MHGAAEAESGRIHLHAEESAARLQGVFGSKAGEDAEESVVREVLTHIEIVTHGCERALHTLAITGLSASDGEPVEGGHPVVVIGCMGQGISPRKLRVAEPALQEERQRKVVADVSLQGGARTCGRRDAVRFDFDGQLLRERTGMLEISNGALEFPE